MGKYAIVVRVWGNPKGKYYNNYRTGETLLFDRKEDAQMFINKLEKESSEKVSFEVIPFKHKNKKETLFNSHFIERIGSKMIRWD